MNIISSIVGITIMGAAAPSIMQMSIAPFEAQKRAQNLGTAESSAVTYAAAHDGALEVSDAPEGCKLEQLSGDAYKITCTEGEGRFTQTISRAFRLMPEESETASRTFPYLAREFGDHQCHSHDPWGLNWNFTASLGPCIPQVLWSEARYEASNPDDWLYDVNNHNGWGSHPDY